MSSALALDGKREPRQNGRGGCRSEDRARRGGGKEGGSARANKRERERERDTAVVSKGRHLRGGLRLILSRIRVSGFGHWDAH